MIYAGVFIAFAATFGTATYAAASLLIDHATRKAFGREVLEAGER